MPKAQFDHRVLVPAPPREVWMQLQLPQTWAGLGPVERVDSAHEGGVLCSYRWSARAGPRQIDGTARTRQALPPELMVIDLHSGEFTGMLTTELEPEAGGTGLTVVLSMESNGILTAMFFGIIRDTIAKGLPEQVENFAQGMGQ